MWNERYAGDEYLFGTKPADFLPRVAEWLTPDATVLAIADGEGRNSVWLAAEGLRVTAFDSAPNAIEKAGKLAAARGVDVAFHLSDLDGWDWSRKFDAVAGIFIQFVGPAERAVLFGRIESRSGPAGFSSCTDTRRGRWATRPAGRPIRRTCTRSTFCARPSPVTRCCGPRTSMPRSTRGAAIRGARR